MELEIYQVDAFCAELFSGNPAAVCPLEKWPEDQLMQNIAAENNLAETAFYIKEEDHFHIRWFTPTVEVDLCGHATLATAHMIFQHKNFTADTIRFSSRSGELRVSRNGDLLTLDFPADTLNPVEITDDMCYWFSARPIEAYKGKTDYLLIFASEADIANAQANMPVIERLKEARGVIISAKGNEVDFVSRFFAPQSGVAEDPVTGSAHATLTPYWSAKLGKKELSARQLSARMGYLTCTNNDDRIEISGKAKTYLIGRIVVK